MFSQFAILDFGMPELIIILAIVLLLFGGKKLPELSKSIGESLKNIREPFTESSTPKEDSKKTQVQVTQEVSAAPAEEKSEY